MKKFLLFVLLMSFFKTFSQPDSFSTTINDPAYGNLDLVLYKYSTRSPNYQIFLYDGTNLTPYSVPEIRTYRGYIANMENSKITAVWYPNNMLYIKTFNGKGEQYGFQINDINTNNLNITALNLPIVTEAKKAELHLTSGYTTNYEWFEKTALSDVETAIAIFENGVNQYDLSIARDIGTSMSTDLVVIPTQESDLFKPAQSNHPGLNVVNTWWNSYGGGGGAGRHKYCTQIYKGGRTSLWRAGFGAMPHEFGHTLDLGHHHNQHDAMHSNQFYLGRDNAIRGREHLAADGANCLEVANPNYTDPMHPYTPEDYAFTKTNEDVQINVLANDVDYNGDLISIHEFDATSYYGGTIVQEGQSLKYTPPAGFIGKDYFFYKAKSGSVQDNTFFWNTGKVSVDVRGHDDLALYYPFEETQGQIIYDQANKALQNNGTIIKGVLSNMSNNSGVSGNCIELGDNQYLAMHDVLDPLTESSTVSIWFNLNEIPAGSKEKRIIYDSGARGGLKLSGLSISIEASKIRFSAQHEGRDDTGADRYKDVNWETGRWYHAVLVVDRDINKVYGYLDGVEVGNSEIRQDIAPQGVIKGYPGIKGRIATAIGAQCKGKLNEDAKNQMKGKIDEFKIFNKALSAAEVLDEYNNPGGNYSCEVGLFEEPIRNSSFEKNVIKIKSEKDKLLFDWYATNDRKDHVLWSDHNSNIPDASHGDNWCSISESTAIYQQIGTWESNKDFTVSFVYGKRTDASNSDLEVSLWVGNNDYPEKNRHLSDIGAQKIDAVLINASSLNSNQTAQQLIELSTNSQSFDCGTPIWIMFENKNATNQTVNLIDNLSLGYSGSLGLNDYEAFKDILIYPNPVDELIFVKSKHTVITRLEIIDSLGRVTKTYDDEFFENEISLSHLTTGIYFLKISNKYNTVVKKIIKT